MNNATRWEIPLLPGDGVGPELAETAHLCMDALSKKVGQKISFVEYPIGHAAYVKKGTSLPEGTINAMRNSSATLLAAMSSKDCPSPSPMGQLRSKLGFFTDIRHCFSVQGSLRQGVDLIIIRECSEGFLSDRNMFMGSGEFMPTPDVALSVRVITRQKCEQIARVAFEYAKSHNRKRITVCHKKVVFTLGCGLFKESVFEQARNYQELELDEENVDGLAKNLVIKPEQYDMILTTNLFGDILSGVAAAQVGNVMPIINASKDNALFYPAHGALSQYAGKQRVNPMGMLYTVSAMLKWLKLDEAGKLLDNALLACNEVSVGSSLLLPNGIRTSAVVANVVNAINKADLIIN